MSGQNCEPLIAELKKLVTVENDQAYKLLQELLSGVTTLERQLAEVRGELEQVRQDAEHLVNKVLEANNYWIDSEEKMKQLHSQLQQAREELEAAGRVVNAAVDYVERSSGPNIDSWPEFQFLKSAIARFQKTLKPLPAAGDGGEK
jgi:flagellar biosynthesis chaperone FliJ